MQNKWPFWFDPHLLLRKLQPRLERFISGGIPRYQKLLLQFLLASAGLAISALIYEAFGIYTGSFTALVVVAIALCGNFFASIVFSLALILVADYFFIPPLGILGTRESLEHFEVIAVVTLVVNILIYFLRATYRNTLQAKGEAVSAAHAMEKLLAHVSHDVRNPLASIKLMAQLVQRQNSSLEKSQQLAGKMIENLERVDSMIQNLLDVSRMRAGQEIPLVYETCELSRIVSRVVEDLSIGVESKIEYRGKESIPGIWGAEGIRRAVENLVTNAIKYGEAGRPISVHLFTSKNTAVIEVHNHGAPISPLEQRTLFESYRRASTGSGSKGWGLGLALVKGIAEAHDGSVEVSSVEEKGTTFRIYLPITNGRKESQKSQQRNQRNHFTSP